MQLILVDAVLKAPVLPFEYPGRASGPNRSRELCSFVAPDQPQRCDPANYARTRDHAACRSRARDEDRKIAYSSRESHGTSSAFSPRGVISYPPVSGSLTMQPLISPSSLV